jgi:MFS family permease
MGAGTLGLGLAANFPLILAARVVSGCGAMVGVVALQRLVIRLFRGRGVGLALGISGSAIPLGIVTVLNTAGPVAEAAGWRAVAVRVGLASLAIGLVYLVVVTLVTRGRELGRAREAADAPLPLRGPQMRPIWITGLVWFSANGAMTAFMTFAPDHYLDLGFGISSRGLFTSVPMWTSAALGMVTGWVTDRHGGRAVFMTVGMTLMGAALVLLPTGLVPPVFTGLALGLALAAVVTPTLAMPGALLPPSHTGRGYGLLATCANIGIFAVPPLAGLVRDASGGYGWPFGIMGLVAGVGVVAAQVLRRGGATPGWSRRALTPAAVLTLALLPVSLLFLGGCGRQDRYTVTDPPGAFAEWLPTGEVAIARGVPAGGGIAACDLWSPDDLVLVGWGGTAVRVRGDLLTSLEFPGYEMLRAVLCEPDGSLLVAGDAGRMFRWSAGSWSPAPALPGDVVWLERDDRGRPLARVNHEPGVFRLDGGAWAVLQDPTRGYVETAWSRPGAGTWVATSENWILAATETGFAALDSLPLPNNGPGQSLVGDGTGLMAYADGGRRMWWHEDGAWTLHEWSEGPYASNLQFVGGVLRAVDWADVWRWDGTRWQRTGTWDANHGVEVATPWRGGALVSDQGSVSLLDGDVPTLLLPGPARFTGLAEVDGRLFVHTQEGALLAAEDAAGRNWRLVARTPQVTGDNQPLSMAVDDRGVLVVLAGDGVFEWTGHDLVARTDVGRPVRRLAPQVDGELLMFAADGLVSLRQGVFRHQPWGGVNTHDIRGAHRRDPTTVEFATRDALYRFDAGGTPEPVWYAAGWTIEAFTDLGAGQGFLTGERQARLVDGAATRDVTPLRARPGQEPQRQSLFGAVRLDDGRLLTWAYDTESFMLRDAGIWYLVQPEVFPPGLNLGPFRPTRLIRTVSGAAAGFDDDFVLWFRPVVGAP